MTTPRRRGPKGAAVYRVVNPRGIPPELNGERIPVFRQREGEELRAWYEGDIYDGRDPGPALARGFLVEEVGGDGEG